MHNHHRLDSDSDSDSSSLLSDQLLLGVFSKLPISHHLATSLVCKRWLYLHGRLVRSLNLLDWHFLESGRIFARFPHLTEIDIARSCVRLTPNSGVLVTFKPFFSLPISSTDDDLSKIELLFPPVRIDRGLQLMAQKYPNLRRIAAFGASEYGLASVADTLQELELHCCGDMSLKGVSGCANLQEVMTGSKQLGNAAKCSRNWLCKTTGWMVGGWLLCLFVQI